MVRDKKKLYTKHQCQWFALNHYHFTTETNLKVKSDASFNFGATFS